VSESRRSVKPRRREKGKIRRGGRGTVRQSKKQPKTARGREERRKKLGEGKK
jgi:hypothetical protein